MPTRRPDIAPRRAAFLRALRRTGNAVLAAEQSGVPLPTMRYHQRRDPDFASEWDAALGYAAAALRRKCMAVGDADTDKTLGGEYAVGRGKNRPMQVRRARAGVLSLTGERRFLAMLGATANVQLAAEAVGIKSSNIYRRRAWRPRFAEEMEAALVQGYDRVELALLAGARRGLEADGEPLATWGDDAEAAELDPLTRLTVGQALTVLSHHHRSVRLKERRRGGRPEKLPPIEEVRAHILREVVKYEKMEARDRARRGEAAMERAPEVEVSPEVEPTPEPERGGPSVRVL